MAEEEHALVHAKPIVFSSATRSKAGQRGKRFTKALGVCPGRAWRQDPMACEGERRYQGESSATTLLEEQAAYDGVRATGSSDDDADVTGDIPNEIGTVAETGDSLGIQRCV